ncbi:MAG: autotransporter-associated beta strand repeat-containing protein [Pirellulales bacterium]|nr:autotransporter-associated beta strand repeat-containing protein [Pirellulales bacterium]
MSRFKYLGGAIVMLGVSALFSLCENIGAAVVHARIDVVQNDAGNNTTSVTVTKAGGSPEFMIRDGSNRGDYNIWVAPSGVNASLNGVLMTCVRENGRDNSATGDPLGTFYATSTMEISGNTYYVPIFQSGVAGAEKNINVAAAWFRYSYGAYGWLGADVENSANNGEMTTVIGHPSISLGVQFGDLATPAGYYSVDLTGLTAGDQANGSSQNGILLVTGAKNEDNFGMSKPNADGTFSLYAHHSATSGGGGENDPIAFVYMPLGSRFIPTGQKDPILLPMGRIKGDGSTNIGQGNFTVVKSTTIEGTYTLTIPGYNESMGTLMISMEGGTTNNNDNIVSYQASGNTWIIQSRDLNACTLESPGLTEMAFSFAFLPDNADIIDRNLRYDSGEWSPANGGIWYNAANWTSNAIPNADGVEAKFGGNLLLSDTVALDEGGTMMAGKLTFDNALASYAIGTAGTTSSILLKNTGGTPAIEVLAGSHVINAGLNLTADAAVGIANGSSLTLAGAVSGSATTNLAIGGLGSVKLGANAILPSGPNFGNLTINGTLDLNGYNAAVNGLSGNGTIDNKAGSDSYTLIVGGNDQSSEFSGVLRNTSGSLGINKIGTGLLTLSGANLHSGPTTVEAGTLKIAATGSIASSSTITVGISAAVPATFDLTALSGFVVGPMQTLRGIGTVDGTAGIALTVRGAVAPGAVAAGVLNVEELNFDNTAGDTYLTIRIGGAGTATSDLLNVSTAGGLTVSGANKTLVNIQNMGYWNPLDTNIPLIGYSGTLGGAGLAGFQLNTSYNRFVGFLSDTGTSINFNITQDNTPRWIGQVADNNWDATTTNWKEKDSGTATTYRETPQRDQVIFDDGADVLQTTINIPANVMPLNVFVNNSARDYTFSGTGKITGSGALVKQGSGTLTVETFNDFTGGTTISGGTLVLTAGAAPKLASDVTVNAGGRLAVADTISLGTRTVNLEGGELQFLATDGFDFINPLTVSPLGGSLDTNGNNIVLNATITADPGNTFTKKGAGTLVLAKGQGGFFNQSIEAGTLRNLTASTQSDSTLVTVAAGAIFDDSYGNGEDFGGLAGAGIAIIHSGDSFTLYGNTTDVFSGKITVGVNGATVPGDVGNFVRAGTGTTTLTGVDSDYGGFTAIRSGTLLVGTDVFEGANGPLGNATGANALILLGNTSGAADAGFYINTAGVTVDRDVNVQLGNTGISTVGGANASGTTTFSGDLILGSGSGAAKGAALSAADGGTVVFSGVIRVGSGVGTAFDITKIGLGKVVLSGANTYPGITTVKQGVLSVSTDGNLGAAPAALAPAHLVLDGGSLQASASFSTNANRGIKLAGTGGAIDVPNAIDTLTVPAVISGNAGLTKKGLGDLLLTAAPTYTGATIIEGGTMSLQLSGGSAALSAISGNGTLHVGDSSTLTASSIAVGSLVIGGATPVAAVPEPSSLALLTIAAIGTIWTIRRRSVRNA